MWGYLRLPNKPESVHLADFPSVTTADAHLLSQWKSLLDVRENVKKSIEEARQAGTLGNPLQGRVKISALNEAYHDLVPFVDQLATLLGVSQAELVRAGSSTASVVVDVAEGEKCGRCWLIRTDVGEHSEHPTLCGRCFAAISG